MKVSSETIAKTLAYCEAHCDNKDETNIVIWVTEHLRDALKREHPRFDKGQFQVEALPIKSRELREAILAKL